MIFPSIDFEKSLTNNGSELSGDISAFHDEIRFNKTIEEIGNRICRIRFESVGNTLKHQCSSKNQLDAS